MRVYQRRTVLCEMLQIAEARYDVDAAGMCSPPLDVMEDKDQLDTLPDS